MTWSCREKLIFIFVSVIYTNVMPITNKDSVLIKRLTLILTFLTCSLTVWSQVTVTGTVISSGDKSLIPGVNVVEKGTSNGTVTREDGSFSLAVTDDNAILIFSYVGYTLQEVSLNGRDNLECLLVKNINKGVVHNIYAL
jgi:hypothetical protein